ncbi:hypothetical protein BDW74DRAFT_179166 [Aspergillus multicolor]|uniref:uncharacterized protein n=1 Tax=Aspergillus multicolor TaxID=41759 RepID=UPI003CCD7B77
MARAALSKLPRTRAAWKQRVDHLNLSDKSLRTEKLAPASKIDEKQWLLLYVLWKGHEKKNKPIPLEGFSWEDAGLDDELKAEAEAFQSNYGSWDKYILSLETGKILKSTFALALAFQADAAGVASNGIGSGAVVTPKRHYTRSQARKERDEALSPLVEKFNRMNLKGAPPAADNSPAPAAPLQQPAAIQTGRDQSGSAQATQGTTPVTPPRQRAVNQTGSGQNGSTQGTQESTPASAATPGSPYSPGEAELYLPLRWSAHRVPLNADFRETSYQALTDGYLQAKPETMTETDTETETADGESEIELELIRALIEVKAALRALTQRILLCMQETAQTVAWLVSRLDIGGRLNWKGRRIHISQDRHQIYIIFAEYGEK